ncbi:MAG TPA: hypothetical protein VJ788_00940, partial [Gemmatimonadota bacterium]|nr:hypothetical protein [Gemmatimonadota bacterium]
MAKQIAYRSAIATLAVLVWAEAGSAQAVQVELAPEMPFALERVIDAAVDAPDVTIVSGDTIIAASDTVPGPLAHFGGRLVLEGRIEGDVTAVGSVVYLRPAARIGGDLTIVGGTFSGTTMADVAGTTSWLREPVTVTATATRVTVAFEPPPEFGFPIEPRGIAGVVIHGYNGVDGLSFGLEAGLARRKDWPRTELSGG